MTPARTYIVELEPGAWIGDVGRLLWWVAVPDLARRFPSERSAKRHLGKARKVAGKSFYNAKIQEVKP